MAEDTPKDRGKLLENFSQDLDLENEESDYSKMSDPNDPQYEPGRSDVDSDIHLDLDDIDQPGTTYRSKNFRKLQKHTLFENSFKKKVFMILCSGFYYSIMHEFNFVFMQYGQN